MIIITTGAPYADIDSIACAFAYKDLLTAKKIKSEIVFSGPINASVPKSVMDWGVKVKNKLSTEKNNIFVIVDISEKIKFPKFVDEDKIQAIYDHRLMFRDEWVGKNIDVKIEEVGACATLIWEEIRSQGLEGSISILSAKLTYTAIFSNTLNFKAGVTTDRDKKAFDAVQKICKLDPRWIEDYYKGTEEEIYLNPKKAILNDTKVVDLSKSSKIVVGQMELWNSRDFIEKNKKIIKEVLSELDQTEWFMTAPSISEGKNYIYTENEEIKKILEDIIGAKFQGDVGVTDKLWLRKEILKKLLI